MSRHVYIQNLKRVADNICIYEWSSNDNLSKEYINAYPSPSNFIMQRVYERFTD